jgi:hypothetical protein
MAEVQDDTVGFEEKDQYSVEWVYLVQIGCERWISSFVNQGKVIEKNQVVRVGPAMANVLLSRTYTDRKTGLTKDFFREATDKERTAHINRLNDLDPKTADPSLLAEAARREAMQRGEVEFSTKREVEAVEEISATPFPTRNRARRSKRSKAE